MKKILLARKETYQDFIDVGLFFLPDQNEFVTWLINKQMDDNTVSGNYFSNIHDALKDFDKRS